MNHPAVARNVLGRYCAVFEKRNRRAFHVTVLSGDPEAKRGRVKDRREERGGDRR